MNPKYRITAGLIGGLGALVLVTQVMLNLGQHGVGLGLTLWALAGFFTILTNALMAATMLTIAITGQRLSFGWMTMVTMSMIVVGVIYHALLAQLFNFSGLNWWTDQAFHTILPAVMLWFWLMETTRHDPRGGQPLWWLIWPAGYAVYAMSRGALTGWYPYPFLNVDQLGLGAVAMNMAAMVVGFAVLGYALNAIGQRMPLRD
ncbi:Pr6Pr family membrane protein [Roseinatronobacter sp.]|uniref:Pr6Pr family membrane protein n=1 Tax=Roseinatronobacter sp. TaxID=1945755 RepID=UPI0025D1E70F|nr:Pr6Pr family membrane protein [Rhodobaca sp.]